MQRRKRRGSALRLCNLELSLENALSRRDLVRLASSSLGAAVRVTGGAGKMSLEHGRDVAWLLADALGGAQCAASVLAGATMVVNRPVMGLCDRCDEGRIHCRMHSANIVRHPGVMDVLPELARLGAPGKTIGVVPTILEPVLCDGFIVIEDDPDDDYYTVVDESAPVCQLIQFSADKPKLTWDDEWRVILEYLDLLRKEGDHRSLHLVYNGGDTTRREVEHVARLSDPANPWWVLLVEDSGREASKLADEFGHDHPSVKRCKTADLKSVVRDMGFAA